MTLEDIYNFLPLTDKLLTGGMPTAEQLSAAAEAGVQVVVNLAPYNPARDLVNEDLLVKSLGMEYINIPVEWDSPNRQSFQEFMSVMDTHQKDKLLVHCRANFRVSGYIAHYRILRLGWQQEEAFKDLRRFWNPADYPIWQKFIEQTLTEEH